MNIQISSTQDNVSAYYRNDHYLAVCDITYLGKGQWYISRVNVPEVMREREKSIGSSLLQAAIKEIIEKYNPESIIVTPGGYSDLYEKQVHFYEKNDFLETFKKGQFFYSKLKKAYL